MNRQLLDLFAAVNTNAGATWSATTTGSAVFWGAQLETGSSATAFQNIGTDKMLVVAGVTKNSDAATGIVAELSANAASNAGTFVSSAPNGAAANYGLYSRGSVAPASAANASSFAAPITNVYTGIGDIGGDLARVRVNGALSATDTSDQGTGNYGNYPLFIGRRNNASLPLNGNIYSLVIAGAAYSAGQISSTESWVAAKTPLGTI